MSLFYFFTIFFFWKFNTLIFTKSHIQFLESCIQRIQTQRVTTDDIVFSIVIFFSFCQVSIKSNR